MLTVQSEPLLSVFVVVVVVADAVSSFIVGVVVVSDIFSMLLLISPIELSET